MGAVDFEKEIAPILQSRCVECHSAKKTKGKLRLDQRKFALERDKDDAVILPGNAKDSELYYRITLPKDDDDVMPPEGDPLTKQQVALITKWINEGANWPEKVVLGSKEKKESDMPPAPDLSAAEKWAADIAMKQIAESGALAMRIAADSDWIDVNYSLVGKDIGDDDLGPLAGISPTVTWLNLAGTKITDAALDQVSQLPALTRLHLENTKITDKGLAKLAGLKQLRYLNVYGTGVTDAGAKQLAGLKNLKQLYLWQTQVTDAGVAALRKAIPNLYVNTGAKLVVVEPEKKLVSINAKCPLSGKDVNPECTVTYKGQVIAFCCGDCKAKFEKNPEKFIAKVENFKDPDAGKLLAAKPINAKCPLSGKDVNPKCTVTYKGQVIAFCCGDCKAKFEKNPEKFIAKVDGFKPPAVAAKPVNARCPLSGKAVDLEYTTTYKQNLIGFCCPICKQVFGQSPDRYIGKVEGFQDPDALKPINAKCPISGKDVNPKCFVVYEGLPIGFCCPKCKAAFEKKIEEYRKKAKPKQTGQPVSTGPINAKCPLSGHDVDSAFVIEYQGKRIGFCCEKCVRKFAQSPAKFIEKIPELN